VEWRWIAFDEDAVAARVPDLNLPHGIPGVPGAGRQGQLRAQFPVEFERQHPAEARNAITLKHDIAAGLQLQTGQRGLEREPAPVNRGSKRGRTDASSFQRISLKLSRRAPNSGSPFTAEPSHS
jgi:hypothetical protein